MTLSSAVARRIELIEEATALEKAGGEWRLRHLLAIFGCHKSSLYRNKWLMSKKIDQPGGPAWRPRDVRLYQANNTGRKGGDRLDASRPTLRRFGSG